MVVPFPVYILASIIIFASDDASADRSRIFPINIQKLKSSSYFLPFPLEWVSTPKHGQGWLPLVPAIPGNRSVRVSHLRDHRIWKREFPVWDVRRRLGKAARTGWHWRELREICSIFGVVQIDFFRVHEGKKGNSLGTWWTRSYCRWRLVKRISPGRKAVDRRGTFIPKNSCLKLSGKSVSVFAPSQISLLYFWSRKWDTVSGRAANFVS